MFARSFEWLRQKSKSSRFKYAVALSALALVILIGVVQAGGPMNQYNPLRGGGQMGWGWGMYKWRWWPPAQPIPTMEIVSVVEDTSWTFIAYNLPEDEDFQVLVGPIYSRGVNGTVVGAFNSSDGVTERIYRIPPEYHGDNRIAVRIQTDHDKPYYSFNWFWNNTTEDNNMTSASDEETTAANDAGTGGADEVASSMEVAAVDSEQSFFVNGNGFDPFSFEICAVLQDDSVTILTHDFPIDEEFFVQMGVMPYYPEAEPYYDGKMKKPPKGGGVPRMGAGEMGAGYNQLWQGYNEHGKPKGEKPGYNKPGYPMPPMPPDVHKPQKPPWYWIPYYDVDSFILDVEEDTTLMFDVPEELQGAYRISILIRTGHDYPYYAYNWFYNNDAEVCEPT